MAIGSPKLDPAYQAIRKSLTVILHPYNDGYVQSHCKEELYMLKCWLEDEYEKLPTFSGEEQWEQDRLIQLLKK